MMFIVELLGKIIYLCNVLSLEELLVWISGDSLSTSSLGCNVLCRIISFHVLWSICLSSSLVHLRKGPEYLTRATAQVFIPLLLLLLLLFGIRRNIQTFVLKDAKICFFKCTQGFPKKSSKDNFCGQRYIKIFSFSKTGGLINARELSLRY